MLILTDKVFVRLSANILINESGIVSNHTALILPKNYEELTNMIAHLLEDWRINLDEKFLVGASLIRKTIIYRNTD